MLSGIASNILVGVVFFWAVLTIICIFGAAVDADKPNVGDKRWWDE